MSRVKTRKEIKESLDATIAEAAEAREQHAEQVNGLQEQIEQLTTRNDELSSELEIANQAISDLQDAATERMEAFDALTANHEQAQSDLTAARAALENPAFADAAIVPTEIDQASEDAEADADEVAAEGEEEEIELTPAEEYEAMESGPERRAFWKANKKAILRDLETRDED